MRLEETILSNLFFSEKYVRKTLPFLDKSYFSARPDAAILDEIDTFFQKYDTLPSKEVVKIELQNRSDLSDQELSSAIELVDSFKDNNTHLDWLIKETESFCKKRAVYNAIVASIQVIDGKNKDLKEDAIPKLLQDALAVSFDVSVGHSYFDDASSRYDFYTSDEEKIPFDLKIFNKIYKNGLPKKALIVVAAQSGGGKSLIMTHISAATLLQGLNVLYISMEMGENKIGERVDANLLNVDISKIIELGKEEFMSRIDRLKGKTQGKLYVKEYPPGSASVSHFRSLVEELKVKQGFVPDLIVVDYLGITASSRMKLGGSVNKYLYLTSVAEELRGLGIELNVPVLTGAQLNRGGFNNSDVDETSLADSMGIYMTADIMFAAIRTDELDELDQLMIKQLKNRYGDPNYFRRFVVGINRAKMKIYDLEESAQDSIMVDTRRPTTDSFMQSRTHDLGMDSLNF